MVATYVTRATAVQSTSKVSSLMNQRFQRNQQGNTEANMLPMSGDRKQSRCRLADILTRVLERSSESIRSVQEVAVKRPCGKRVAGVWQACGKRVVTVASEKRPGFLAKRRRGTDVNAASALQCRGPRIPCGIPYTSPSPPIVKRVPVALPAGRAADGGVADPDLADFSSRSSYHEMGQAHSMPIPGQILRWMSTGNPGGGTFEGTYDRWFGLSSASELMVAIEMVLEDHYFQDKPQMLELYNTLIQPQIMANIRKAQDPNNPAPSPYLCVRQHGGPGSPCVSHEPMVERPGYDMVVVNLEVDGMRMAIGDSCSALAHLIGGLLYARNPDHTRGKVALFRRLAALIFDEKALPFVWTAVFIDGDGAPSADVQAHLCGASTPGTDVYDPEKAALTRLRRTSASAVMDVRHYTIFNELADLARAAKLARGIVMADTGNCAETDVIRWMILKEDRRVQLATMRIRFVTIEKDALNTATSRMCQDADGPTAAALRSAPLASTHATSSAVPLTGTFSRPLSRLAEMLTLPTYPVKGQPVREKGVNLFMAPCRRCKDWIQVLREWAKSLGLELNIEHEKPGRWIQWTSSTVLELQLQYRREAQQGSTAAQQPRRSLTLRSAGLENILKISMQSSPLVESVAVDIPVDLRIATDCQSFGSIPGAAIGNT
ncbi:hypothetical protein CALVIDRAFT_532064 [Calocera viscosa TUFC12733]|uniref:Uncharacterized protein n=1 Tax=Calocera viscosa (strain TUFC12733) TaxID=1330018 RepID=A0A167FH00_CALVF|nr:hypothetical protein CALVIDRAFT_532064 [Calocera viscosa TUFC12733]